MSFNQTTLVLVYGLAITSLAVPTVAWWGSTTDATNVLFFILIIGGLFILWRQKRWHIVAPFFISYAFFLILLSAAQGTEHFYILLKSQLFNGVTVFFASVMLIEPLTSTFDKWQNENIYGAIVGGMIVFMAYLTQQFSWFSQDPLIYGLLANLIASLLFLPANRLVPRQT